MQRQETLSPQPTINPLGWITGLRGRQLALAAFLVLFIPSFILALDDSPISRGGLDYGSVTALNWPKTVLWTWLDAYWWDLGAVLLRALVPALFAYLVLDSTLAGPLGLIRLSDLIPGMIRGAVIPTVRFIRKLFTDGLAFDLLLYFIHGLVYRVTLGRVMLFPDIRTRVQQKRAGIVPQADEVYVQINRSLLKNVIIHVLLFLGAALILIPFFWMLSTSLKTEAQLYVFPPQWRPDPKVEENYIDAWKTLGSIAPGLTFLRIMGNTLFITALAMFAEMFSAAIVAYGFARFRFRGRDVLFFIMLATMMIPGILTRIPAFLIWKELGLLNTYDPLTVPAWFAWGPAYVFLLRQFFLTIPRDMEDAAIVDGANTIQIFFWIMLPLVRPAFLAIGVLSFQGNWNNFEAPLIYLRTTQMFPLVLVIQFFQESLSLEAPKWHYMMAMATMMAAPILALFFAAQRYFIEGLTVGAVKG